MHCTGRYRRYSIRYWIYRYYCMIQYQSYGARRLTWSHLNFDYFYRRVASVKEGGARPAPARGWRVFLPRCYSIFIHGYVEIPTSGLIPTGLLARSGGSTPLPASTADPRAEKARVIDLDDLCIRRRRWYAVEPRLHEGRNGTLLDRCALFSR